MSNVLGCICKDEVGSITEVEGNINSVKCVDILDNLKSFASRFKIRKLSVDFPR